MIVPFPAGGPTDTVARIMSEHMSKTLGQSILVETVTGAGATIGVGRVVNAPPDGYTVIVGNWSSHVGSPALYPVSWNPVNDLEPVIRLPVSSLMIVGKESLPAKNAKELIAWLKANPDKASAASVGAGSGAHVCGLYFGEKTGTKFQFVFYRGGAPAMQDMLAGTIDIMCAEASQTLAHVQAGKIKAFAVMGRKRYAGLPDVPTMEEMGITGMDISFWHGLWAPKGTPKEIVDKLNDAAVKALADPVVQKRVAALGMTIPEQDRTDAEGAARLPQGRDRQVVADHQVVRHQSELIECRGSVVAACARRCHRRRGAGAGADLSVEAGHHDRAVPGGRRLRHPGAHRRREHAAVARPAGDRRERRRRRRHDRHRARRALAARRLHHRLRPVDLACRLRRAVSDHLRSAEGPDADRAADHGASCGWSAEAICRRTTLKELIAWLKANPDKATAATIGAGSGTQLCLVYLQQNTGTRFQLVPYRGTAPIFTDLLAGHVDLTCPEAGQTLALYRSGKIKAYAVMDSDALVCRA